MAVNYFDLGRQIKEKRKSKQISQADLAAMAEMSTQHLCNIENARTKVSLDKLIRIANVLECSVDELICESLAQFNKL